MKLVLANRQSAQFRDFYGSLAKQSREPFDYSPYDHLLFVFDTASEAPVAVHNLAENRLLTEYDGVYVNGYLATYELAAAAAICCEALGVPFVNRELENPPSLSKLSSYAKLAAKGVSLPKTFAGAKAAIIAAAGMIPDSLFPGVLKRADADRGIDNYKVADMAEVLQLLDPHDEKSLWILQEFVPNNGFYLISFYDQKAVFSIFRALEERPDRNARKAHMFKPKGGANARLVPLEEVPAELMKTATAAVTAMNRQIGSVDLIYDQDSERAYVLEVNYNPQLVTIETFKKVRVDAFLDYLNQDWKKTLAK